MDDSSPCHKVAYKPHMAVERTGAFCPKPKTAAYTTCNVMETPNLGRHETSLVCYQGQPITAAHTTCNVTGALGANIYKYIEQS